MRRLLFLFHSFPEEWARSAHRRARIQATTVHPSVKFKSRMAGCLGCRYRAAVIVGRKYRRVTAIRARYQNAVDPNSPIIPPLALHYKCTVKMCSNLVFPQISDAQALILTERRVFLRGVRSERSRSLRLQDPASSRHRSDPLPASCAWSA